MMLLLELMAKLMTFKEQSLTTIQSYQVRLTKRELQERLLLVLLMRKLTRLNRQLTVPQQQLQILMRDLIRVAIFATLW